MRIEADERLTESDIQKGLKNVIRDGIATQAMVTLTCGVFLVTFAIELGASNAVIGLLAALPPLLQFVQIPSVYLVEKYKNRRVMTVLASLANKSMLLLVGCIPLVIPPDLRIPVLIAAIALRSLFVSIGACSWHSWMRDLVPRDEIGSFFSERMRLSKIVDVPLALLVGVYLDHWKKAFANELHAYTLLYFTGFFIGLLGVYYIYATPEPRIRAQSPVPFIRLLQKPFKETNFKNLIGFMASWSFAVNLAAPFFTVYMLKRLGLDLSLIVGLTVLSQVVNIAFLRIWGDISDRFSHKSVLRVSGPLFIMGILAWTFTTFPEKHVLTLPLLVVIHIVLGMSTAGVTLASSTIGLKLAPRGEATVYLAAISLINSLSAGIAPILGGLCADFFAQRELALTLTWLSPQREIAFQTLNLQQWDFFFFLAFVIGLYSIHRLSMVRESGEVKEKIVINELISEMRRGMKNLSSVAGLNSIVLFPFSLIQTIYKNRKNNSRDRPR
jgi:MFS family permease